MFQGLSPTDMPAEAMQTVLLPLGDLEGFEGMAIFNTLARQCLHVARGSYSRSWLTGLG